MDRIFNLVRIIFGTVLNVPQGIETGTYATGDHDYGIVPVLVKDDNICVSELNITKLTRLGDACETQDQI